MSLVGQMGCQTVASSAAMSESKTAASRADWMVDSWADLSGCRTVANSADSWDESSAEPSAEC